MAERDRAQDKGFDLGPRTILGGVLALLLLLFIVLNTSSTNVSFIFFSTETPLWVALAIAGVVGAAAGFLAGRRFYRRD